MVIFQPLLHARALAEPPAEGYFLLHNYDPAVRQGSILFLTVSPAGKISQQQGPNLPLPDSPVWTGMTFTNAGDRKAFWIVQREGQMDLCTLDWPRGREPMNARVLATWKGQFVAGHVSLDGKELPQGLLLAWLGGRLTAVPWALGPKDVELKAPLPLDWAAGRKLTSSSFAMEDSCKFAAVLGDSEGNWSMADSEGKVTPAPQACAKTKRAELYFDSPGIAIIRYLGPDGAFRYVDTEGEPHPSW